jgi:predicted porin
MKKSLIALAVAGALTAPMVAQAADGSMVDAYLKDRLVVSANYDSISDSNVDLGVGSFTAEYALTDIVGAKFEYGTGLSDDSVAGVTVDVDTVVTLAATLDMPISTNVNLLGELGYSDTEVEARAGGVTSSDSDGDWYYEAGLSYNFHNGFTTHAALGDWADSDDAEYYTIGVTYDVSNSPFAMGLEYTDGLSSNNDSDVVRTTLSYAF